MTLTWQLKTNIKGPAGDIESIPDPLVLDTVHVNTALEVGTRLRLAPITGGGKVEAKNDGGTWIDQAEWKETVT